MAVIKVPKTPRKSFDPSRRPSALLLEQIKHLEWAALPAVQRSPGGDLPRAVVRTEGAAAERIAQLTTLIRTQQDTPYQPGEAAAVVLPPLPRSSRAVAPARGPKARPARARKAPARRKSAAASRSAKATSGRTSKAAPASKTRKRGTRGRKTR